MTQPFQYDPSQQPGQPSGPFDPAQQPPQHPGPPASPFDAAPQPGQQPYDPARQPFDPAQQPPPLDAAGHQPPGYESAPGQQPQSPFGPSSEASMFPPQPNFLPPEPPKKSRGGLLIVLGLVVLLLIGGGVGVAIWRPWAPAADSDSSDKGDDDDKGDKKDGKGDDDADADEGVPSQVVDDAWHAKDWDEAKTYMCDELASQLEADGAAEDYKPTSQTEEFETTDEKIEDSKATVTVETTVDNDGKAELGVIDVSLVKEDSDWKICEIGDPK